MPGIPVPTKYRSITYRRLVRYRSISCGEWRYWPFTLAQFSWLRAFLSAIILINVAEQVVLASFLINAWPLLANEMGTDQSAVRSWHCRLNTFFY